MAFSSGTFSLYTPGNPVVTGTTISISWANNTLNDIATGLSTCLLKDGSQTVTANIPMAGFKFTGLGAGTASGNSLRYEQVNGVVTTAGDMLYATGAGALARIAIGTAYQGLITNSGATAPSWASSLQSLMTTTGDTVEASAANTPARMAAAATVAAHATTMDPWVARTVTLSGGAVTFTDIADADYVGQRVLILMNAAHVWTDGAVFDVQGGATYTTAAGDWVELVATAVDAFDVTILPALGQPVSMQPITNSLAADVALNNTANFFTGPTVAQGTAGTWFASGTVTITDTAGGASFTVKLWDGTTVIASTLVNTDAATRQVAVSLSGRLASPAGNIRFSVKDATSTSGAIIFNASGESKDSTLTAIRIA